jgi:IS30 family transposase
MYGMDTHITVKTLLSNGVSRRKIAEQLGIHRRVIKRIERNSAFSARRAETSDSKASILASKTVTKSFSTFISFDNSMNRICSVKQIYTDLG